MPQQTLTEFVEEMEKAGLLVRVTEEKRVDELPAVMEANPLTAVLVENVKDCEFQFLANAYSNQDQYAWGLGCDKSQSGFMMSELAKGRIKPEIVDTAPCKEVILTGDDVDLTRLPLFLLCAAYLLPGLFVRDPWRNADVNAFGIMAAMAREFERQGYSAIDAAAVAVDFLAKWAADDGASKTMN